ncbi:hypothetical protein AT5G62573 [Arabidopsis thaliana]|uniref:Uncharacterized protein n=2 Tax=Arabidopsis thaliana TaxID=3702 RepID=A0A5S9YIM5_ARATH|nr:uncharacterized protein AT5G62573 [Arabidopsis thaliana]ANM70664.1 hypothetical protein AT5G62573 [Arabidopsis thaliana]CAA0411537.1 unnamed protein product [Arabidopsis thaliana]|eukprot:NP_001332254.1 hypothetical protein AT5G62573 [Arabidopsis thaliana]
MNLIFKTNKDPYLGVICSLTLPHQFFLSKALSYDLNKREGICKFFFVRQNTEKNGVSFSVLGVVGPTETALVTRNP